MANIEQQDMPAYMRAVEPEYVALEVYDQVEEEGVSGAVFNTSILVIVGTMVLIVIIASIYALLLKTDREAIVKAELNYPVKMEVKAQAAEKLENYGYDATTNKYYMPISEAMKALSDKAWQENQQSSATEVETEN